MSAELDKVFPGQNVGPYKIVRAFQSRGGMARVFEVEVREKYRRPGFPRRLAMKIAKPEFQASLSAEADFLSRFNHPHVVRIYPIIGYHKPVWAAREQFPFGEGWYYTMELLTSGSLQSCLHRPTTLTDLLRTPADGDAHPLHLLEVIVIARQIAMALEHIHERFVVNLDVKPGNILFRHRSFRYMRGTAPHAVLSDFGIARDLRYPRAGLLGVVTPEYVSPEHALETYRPGQVVDARSDIFSMGIVVYEMATGQLPFENIACITDPDYRPVPPREIRPAIPPDLESIVMRCLEKDPDRRFQSARELCIALERVPTPMDWPVIARRATVAAALFAFSIGGWGLAQMINRDSTTTPVPSTVTPIVVTPPVTVVPPVSETPPTPTLRPTSTPVPTKTPTPTPRPVTPTPSPVSGSGG